MRYLGKNLGNENFWEKDYKPMNFLKHGLASEKLYLSDAETENFQEAMKNQATCKNSCASLINSCYSLKSF